MRKATMLKFALLLSTCAIGFINPAVGAEIALEKAGVAWGIWADQDQANVYAFLEKNDFKFRRRHQGKSYTLEGAWQSALGACWSDKDRQQTGNLLIYVNTVQCCMSAQFLGNNLVLTYIWDRPGGGASPEPDRFCQNRVLRKLQSMPKD